MPKYGFFEVKIPNEETIQAMQEGKQPDKLKSYQSFSEARADL